MYKRQNLTLQPAQGRKFELPSIMVQETVSTLRYLMRIPQPSPDVIAAIEGGAAWLRKVQLQGLRLETLSLIHILDLPSIVMTQQIAAGTGSASLIAIPLFIFAGEIMMRGGISERLISLAASLVGRMRGGLGQVSILSSLLSLIHI